MLWDELQGRPDAEQRLASHPILTRDERSRLEKVRPPDVARASHLGVRLATAQDFPEHLAVVGERLPAVFVWGDWDAVKAPTIGIVGTRSASNYGKAAAFKFAEAFASAGATVVSGGALGIDAAAHKGAMAAGGRTVAVLAGGVDNIYPRVHAALFAEIRLAGCLVSQFGIGSQPTPYRFLVRNRLIAALSQALVVIEAPERSGALSTAGAANDMSRDVYVVPSNIDHVGFRGSHALIRDGAILVDHPDQVLEALDLRRAEPAQSRPELTKTGRLIVSSLSVEPLSAEKISEKTGLDSVVVLSELTMLELEGVILRQTGGYAVRL